MDKVKIEERTAADVSRAIAESVGLTNAIVHRFFPKETEFSLVLDEQFAAAQSG